MSREEKVKKEKVKKENTNLKEKFDSEEKLNFEEEKIEDKTENKEKKKKREIEAVLNIYTSFNNTLAHVTDMSGVTLAKVTGGMVTKHSRLKANPTVAMFIAKRIMEKMKELGVTSLYVRIRSKTHNPAPGPGPHTIIKSLTREGIKILNILDTTRVPRGGPKKKGGRRGRRP